MENKNTIIAIVLMLAVWVGFTVLFPPAQKSGEKTAVEAPIPQESVSKTVTENAAVEAAPVEVPPVAGNLSQISAVNSRELTVDTDTLEAIFTNSGARLKSLKLKDYHVEAGKDSPRVALVDVDDNRLSTLRTEGSGGLALPSDLVYSISLEGDTVEVSGDQSVDVAFSATTADGLRVTKVYTFRGNRYDFDLKIRLENNSSSTRRGNLLVSLVNPWNEDMAGNRYNYVGPATLAGEKVQKDKVKDLSEESPSYSNAVWTSFEKKYFISAVVPLAKAGEKTGIEKSGNTVVNTVESPLATLAPRESIEHDFLLYFGPRDLDILKKVDHQLDQAVNFGIFSVIALPLRHVLNFFYKYVGNYGVAIILLTVIIKGLFWPLTQKSYTSMRAMQKLQPEMQKVRERFKNDRERMNREIMEMYKKHRVNPLGGCLPMVIQIPVFFALYRVLLGDIALRHAPFAFWLTDLSAKDPYYITPIIMGVTMLAQQRLTPSSMDPTQAKMFLLMPVVFTFLFLNFPSGLVIYWLTNNILTIVQQVMIKRKV